MSSHVIRRLVFTDKPAKKKNQIPRMQQSRSQQGIKSPEVKSVRQPHRRWLALSDCWLYPGLLLLMIVVDASIEGWAPPATAKEWPLCILWFDSIGIFFLRDDLNIQWLVVESFTINAIFPYSPSSKECKSLLRFVLSWSRQFLLKNMKGLLLFLTLLYGLSLAVGEKQGNVTVPAQYYYAIVSVNAPFQLSYTIQVIGGSQAGIISIYLVDQANYNKIVSGSFDSFSYIVAGSRLDVTAANVTDINIEGSGTYYVVLLNQNLLFSVTVEYNVLARASVAETLGAGLIALIVILAVGCCICSLVTCLVICIIARRKRANMAREAEKALLAWYIFFPEKTNGTLKSFLTNLLLEIWNWARINSSRRINIRIETCPAR